MLVPMNKIKHVTVTSSGKATPPKSTVHTAPRLHTRARNLGEAMFRWVANGFPVEGQEEASRRVGICESNECGYYNGNICLHQKCGCYANIKKFIATEHCPIGKW